MISKIGGFLLLLVFTFSGYYTTANTEVEALKELKSTMVDPNGVLRSWDITTVNPCTWYNITCNSDNSVVRIDLGNANLTGQLVPALGQLSNLQYLELYHNNINGKIPSELGNLTNLVSLDLYMNNLTGPIPDTLGNLSKLRYLKLNNNNLSGEIPMSLTSITTLQILDLSFNQLSGMVPTNGSFSFFNPICYNGNQNLKLPTSSVPTGLSPSSGINITWHTKWQLHFFIAILLKFGVFPGL